MFAFAWAQPRPCTGAADVLGRHAPPRALTLRLAGQLTGGQWSGGVPSVNRVASLRALCPRGEGGSGAGALDDESSAASLVSGGTTNVSTSTAEKSKHIFWHDCPVAKNDRDKLLKQKGCVLWITGLSGSGKSTLACALSHKLHSRGHLTYILDGDNLRHALNKDLGFKPEDRAENIRRVGEVAKLFADAGLICITSLISPYKRGRDACRELLPNNLFIEVFLHVPLEVCAKRDPKGLYKLARAGKIKGFTGVDDPYEAPSECEIVIEWDHGKCPSPGSMADQVVSYLEEMGYLSGE